MKIAVYIPSFNVNETNQAQQGVMLRELVDPLIPLLKKRVEIVFFSSDGRPCMIADESYHLQHWEENASKSMNSIRMLRHLFAANFLKPESLAKQNNSARFFEQFSGLYLPSTYRISTNLKEADQVAQLIKQFAVHEKPILVTGVAIAYLNHKTTAQFFSTPTIAVAPKLVRNLSFLERITNRMTSRHKLWEKTKEHSKKLGYSLIDKKKPIQNKFLITASEGSDCEQTGSLFLQMMNNK